MPYKDPMKQRECKKRWRDRNKPARTTYQRNYRRSHPEYRKKHALDSKKWYANHPEAKLFYAEGMNLGKMKMLTELGGCCVLCFNIYPFELEIHHPFGRKAFPQKRIILCHKCHTLIHRKERSERARKMRLNEWGKCYDLD